MLFFKPRKSHPAMLFLVPFSLKRRELLFNFLKANVDSVLSFKIVQLDDIEYAWNYKPETRDGIQVPAGSSLPSKRQMNTTLESITQQQSNIIHVLIFISKPETPEIPTHASTK